MERGGPAKRAGERSDNAVNNPSRNINRTMIPLARMERGCRVAAGEVAPPAPTGKGAGGMGLKGERSVTPGGPQSGRGGGQEIVSCTG